MAALDFPTSPALNQTYTSNGVTYQWNGVSWKTANPLTSTQITTALGYTPYNSTNPNGYTTNTGTVTAVTGTSPIVSTNGTTPAISITAATTSAAGSMSAADKTKLDGVAANATANTGTVTSVGGTGAVSGISLSGTVTTTGNLTLGGTLAVTPSNFASQTANTVLAAPNGTNGIPSFRSLVLADIPAITLESLPTDWPKRSVDCATVAQLTVNTAQATIDGVTINGQTRVLVKDQSTTGQNGIYTSVNTTTWVRATDADTADKLSGAVVNVDAGTVNSGRLYKTYYKPSDALGPAAVVWYQILDSNSSIPTSKLTGTLPVLNGGTGTTTATGTGSVVLSTTPTVTGSREVLVAGGAGGAYAVDLAAGNYFTRTFNASGAVTVTNVPVAGIAQSFIFDITNAGAFTITWPTGTKWNAGAAPTLTAAGRDILGFFTHDGGITWNALVLSKDIK